MKKNFFEFFHRGLIACGFGPVVLAIVYLALQSQAGVESLSVNQVCMGIFSISALAFIVGGMNVVYQIEKLPLMLAILIHGGVLYLSYLAVYLLNGWLEKGITPIVVFSVIFVVAYLVIWAIIYFVTKNKAAKVNEMLEKKRASAVE